MKMLYCRKCGAAMFSDETLAQTILDKVHEATNRASHGPGKYRAVALQEAAEYRSMYKALMHNITQKEYAETVTPLILRAMTDEVKRRGLLTDEEIETIYEDGKALALARKTKAEREERLIYGQFETACNRSKPDPTADKAIANVDRELQRRRSR